MALAMPGVVRFERGFFVVSPEGESGPCFLVSTCSFCSPFLNVKA